MRFEKSVFKKKEIPKIKKEYLKPLIPSYGGTGTIRDEFSKD